MNGFPGEGRAEEECHFTAPWHLTGVFSVQAELNYSSSAGEKTEIPYFRSYNSVTFTGKPQNKIR